MPLDTNRLQSPTRKSRRSFHAKAHHQTSQPGVGLYSTSVLLFALFVSFSTLLLGGSVLASNLKKDEARVAESIRQRIESELFTLEPEVQGHYALRMYRMTGDERYLPPIVFDLLVNLENLRSDLSQAHDPGYVAGRCATMRDNLNPSTRKGRIRIEMFKRWGAVQFYLNLLHTANAMAELGVKNEAPFKELFQASLAECKPDSIRSFLLDTAVIRGYAPQAVNYVYYLYDLGLADIRQAYTEAFRATYPDKADQDMEPDEFSDKVYGLTHFITAASRYYQKPVDSAEFGWILDYFDKNLNRILDDTREDVVAEVGLCFLLARRDNDPVVSTCRKRMIDRFDSGEGLIPSTTGRTDLAQSEHRNVIAYMLLAWNSQLHPGPDLPASSYYQKVLKYPDKSGE